ncbi:uncharacterized protein LOC103155413 isoform X3 [Poecilia formosa]|uniref:uncharacterized protein LOC103155413 isoform X3 n=1 Tax=Poecilia formosa TaxID=48698 RepID=UPI0007B880DE|nr:PREDICTED: uncharacterized protein LOC103155413 isoform X3 [Poecilia formosa]
MMMQTRQNRRGYTEYFVTGHHLNLTDLKTEGKNFKLRSNYLYEDIPNYPKPEFHVSRLKHETGELGLRGIRGDGGFRTPDGESKIWWSLAVGPDEINNAEMRLPENRFPDRRSVAPEQQRFLWKFATSPAFKETSRLGSFRFTFPLQEVLTAYRDQICSGDDPVMRVYETVLYKQEVMYTVLVHSPDLNKKFSNYPLLTDDPNSICVYKDGCFIWRSEAMCETHWYEFNEDQMEARRVRDYQFYVWDHVALALHVENDQVLKLDFKKPEDFLTYCENDDVAYVEGFQDHDKANELVKELWPEWLGALKVERPLQMHYPVTELKLVLTGRCGEETSSTGNTLSGKQAFYSSGLDSVDMKLDNLEVKIINTPEFSELTTKEEIKETLNYIRCSGPALHVFLLVISLKNITADLIRTTVQRFESIFQNKALRRTMILFTHQDQTEPDIQEIMQKVQQFLTEKVGNRCLVFNNRLEDRDPQRVSDLLRQVKKILGGE